MIFCQVGLRLIQKFDYAFRYADECFIYLSFVWGMVGITRRTSSESLAGNFYFRMLNAPRSPRTRRRPPRPASPGQAAPLITRPTRPWGLGSTTPGFGRG